MARPRSFDVDDAIERAMQVFWQHGYEEAGLTELLDAMGIVRGSFYKAFGSKQDLFLRVLERYDETAVSMGLALLGDDSRPGRERIAAFFVGALDTAGRGDRRGCLLCNTAAGPILDEGPVAEAVQAQMARLTDGFALALADDARLGDDAARLGEARRLLMNYVGLRVLGRGGLPIDALGDAVRPVLADYGHDWVAGATVRLQ